MNLFINLSKSFQNSSSRGSKFVTNGSHEWLSKIFSMFQKSIKLRVHHALNFAGWAKENRSDDDIRSFLRANGYDESVVETSVVIMQKFRDRTQRIRILGYRNVRDDEVCKSCTLQREIQQCNLPPKKGFGDRDTVEAERYDLYPSIFSTTSGEIQELRPRGRGFYR